ncbi:MAG: LapA family protein [Candidatus Magnetoovum sp. WYHC-5]|nr:LapA family protein [Candidatus Magnetoovum sp. WYHC-5]
MIFNKTFLVILIVLFLFVVFIDQNFVHVPIKLFFGGPFHLQLSVIILASMGIGALITLIAVFITNNVKKKINNLKEKEIRYK